MRPALPLSVQLLLTFVGLLVGMTAVLTTAAYSTLLYNLEADARRNVAAVTRTRDLSVTQLFQMRQQRAEGFLDSLQSMCAEPLDSGRLVWVEDCVRTMVDDFRKGERALGAALTYRNRRVRGSGQMVAAATPPPGALAGVIRREGAVEYVMQITRRQLTMTLQFDDQAVADLFAGPSGLGRSGEIWLVDFDGRFLSSAGGSAPKVPADRARDFVAHCREGVSDLVDLDYRGIEAIQSFRPLSALGTACVAASVGYDETLAPADRLRAELITRGAWFVLIGAVLSLVAAQWIASPVRRLALTARNLQRGRFDRPIPLSGPSEVRDLGRAFNAMANDLAELVAREQAARREAEAANRSKDEFLATVSHELRTPLTAILGWAQMLRSERLAADRIRHALAVIERSARAQRQLIDDLLDVSRITSNRLRIAREPVRLAEVVEAALDTVRPQAAMQGIEIETELASSAVVLGDARRLEQVIWNLAFNAVKFTQPSGRIRVKLTQEGSEAKLSVADTGIGISSAFLPHVFEWFRQADARSRSQSGLGLGLGIVRHLVKLHGGSVRAESRGVGQGATFLVTLPIHQPAAALPSQPRRAEVPRPIADRLLAVRVLVVEDDEDTRELVRITLESAGASVDVVGSPADARREMLADAPDVLISDIRMPEEDGYALIRSLRRAGVATPAIALTAFARRDDVDEARAAGFQLHISKPVDATHLVEAVATLVENHTVH